MKAVSIAESGGPESLVYGQRPEPIPGRREVVVSVKAAALNRIDIWARTGKILVQMPLIPGADIAGVVTEIGVEVEKFRPGDRVLFNPAITCGRCEYCLRGEHGTCRQRQMIGLTLDGGYAEFAKAPEENVFFIPEALSFEEAAAIPVSFFTAWQLVVPRGEVRPGETVLVIAAGSGVGSAALQIAKKCGAQVIATASSAAKLERARELGADETINYATEDFAKRVLSITDGAGVDVIIDPVGAAVWEGNLASLKAGGRLVCCGFTGGSVVQLDIRQLLGSRLSIIGSGPLGSKAEARQVMELVNRGELKGVVARVFDLKEAALAHRVMESRDFFGKLILQP